MSCRELLMQNTISVPYTGASISRVPTDTTLRRDNVYSRMFFSFFIHQPEATGVLIQRLATVKTWEKKC